MEIVRQQESHPTLPLGHLEDVEGRAVMRLVRFLQQNSSTSVPSDKPAAQTEYSDIETAMRIDQAQDARGLDVRDATCRSRFMQRLHYDTTPRKSAAEMEGSELHASLERFLLQWCFSNSSTVVSTSVDAYQHFGEAHDLTTEFGLRREVMEICFDQHLLPRFLTEAQGRRLTENYLCNKVAVSSYRVVEHAPWLRSWSNDNLMQGLREADSSIEDVDA